MTMCYPVGFLRTDHRGFRPEGWVEAGRAKLDRVRPIAERHALALQLACAWNLAHGPWSAWSHPDQEPGEHAKPIERKREELAAVPSFPVLTEDEVDEIRRVGDNRGSMLLKGATPDHEGEPRPDRWGLDEELEQVARRWAIDPARDLRAASAVVARAR